MKNLPCVGLFGTCGNSKWREDFIARLAYLEIPFFNPQVENWTPELADIEAQHLKRDEIILFPVTGETYGTGSLAETGFSIIQAVSSNTNRWIVLMIEDTLDESLMADAVAAKESLRARKLVKAHLAANPHPNVFVVDSMPLMLNLSIELYRVARDLNHLSATYGAVA